MELNLIKPCWKLLLMNTCSIPHHLYFDVSLPSPVRTAGKLTRHVHHPAVAILHYVACFTVDPAGSYTVDLEKARLQSFRLALAPWGRQVGQLQVGNKVEVG